MTDVAPRGELPVPPVPAAEATVFPGASEMAARCRALDWAATPLGPVAGWSAALRGAVRLCLEAGFPGCVHAGEALVLVYNDGFAAILGEKHPAAFGRPAREALPEIWAEVAADFARVHATGAPVVRSDARFVLARGPAGRGVEGFYTYTFSPLRDDAGAVVGVYNVVTETTARVRAERALVDERERLRAVILATPAPLAFLEGSEHRHTLVNDAYKRVTGGGRDVTGLTPPEAFPELAGSGIYELFDRVYATGEPWDGPETHLRLDRDGTGVMDTWFNLRFEPVRAAGLDGAVGPVAGVLSFAVDVTEQVRARREVERALGESERARADTEAARVAAERAAAALAESEARFRAVEDASPDAVLLLRPLREGSEGSEGSEGGGVGNGARDGARDGGAVTDFEFVYGNPAADRMLAGGAADAFVGRRMLTLFPGSVPEGIFAAYVRALETGVPYTREQRYTRDGLDVGVRVTAVRAGGLLHLRHEDIAERLQAEAERARLLAESEAARAEAEAANRTKGEFLAVMSHELRTPLNAIGGYAELIELGIHGPVTDAQRTALARIQASQRHLLGLVAGVLDYSRVEAGAVTYRLVDVPVGEAVAEAEALVAPQLRARGLGYAWSGVAPGVAVRADREKLQQVLLNLLGNAVKFTNPRGGVPGRIEVACTVEAADGGGASAGGRVHLTVRDTGEGIAAEQLERIFEPFVQVDQRLTRAHAGVGLGLAISRDLARGMGGDLAAESTPGVGSTFTLTLPAAP